MKKRDVETYQKRFRDFEILPKCSKTHVFPGTIRHPYSCHCHHHHHHKAFILITVIQSLPVFSSSSFIFTCYRHEAKARVDNFTQITVLSIRASSWCLCLQECGKGLILISFIICCCKKKNCFLWYPIARSQS